MKIFNYSYKPDTNQAAAKRRMRFFKKPFKKIGGLKLFTWLFRAAALGVVLFALIFLYYSKDLPDPNRLLERQVPESTKIFDREGGLLYEIHGEAKRTLVGLDQISPYAKNATIAIEDKNFYQHGGVSITGIIRSIIVDILHGEKRQGGSTITQQFVKNAILSKNKSFDRKLKEIILSLAIEARFSKDQILKLYLNEIPYGRNAYGIEAAAQTYFGKSAKDLSLAESAYLAALPQAPTYYNPLGPNRAALDGRKNTILELMKEQGYISQEQERQAKEEKIEFQKVKTAIRAPHFVFMVQDYLANKYGEKTLQEGGLKVYTTLSPSLQKFAEEAVQNAAEKNATKYNAYNAALVAIDPKTGQILAMVGSKNYSADPQPAGCTPGKNCLFEPNVNAALSPLQPGSSFKPYVYVTAFGRDFKYSPATKLMDVVTNFGKYGNKDYIPQNYDGAERGPVSMRKALAGSLNIPAVKTLALVGVENAAQIARNLGITSPLSNCGLSLVLGGCEVKLLDHVAAYAALATEGVKHEKTAILKILDKNDNVLEEYQDNSKTVLDPQAAYQLISILTDNEARSFIFGSRSPLILPGRTVAAKTGTTQKWHDGWTLGFTPSLAAGVWAGNNDGTFMKAGADGVYVAAPIWNEFMTKALAGTPNEEFTVPEGITKVTVDTVSGKLPTQYTPSTKEEIFADYNVPTEYDDVHVAVAMDLLTGQVATPLTPPERIYYKPYTVLHSERPDDPAWENPVMAWATTHGYEYPPLGNSLPPPNNGQGPQIAILDPQDDEVIENSPFTVTVSAVSPNQIARMDIFIDGQFVQSKTAPPFTFEINKNYPDGRHTIAVKAVDFENNTSDTSASVIFGSNSPLTLTDPPADSLVIFPLTLTATSGQLHNNVSFYYQDAKGEAKLIAKADQVSNFNGGFRYSFRWTQTPPKGKYKLFAKTDTGIETQKVTITVP